MFNSLAGSADQMGSFIKLLKQELDLRNKQIEEKDNVISELKEEIKRSKLNKHDKDKITSTLNKIYFTSFNTSNITKDLMKSIITATSLNIDPKLFKLSLDFTNALNTLNIKTAISNDKSIE
ncbi:hypothetical protein ABEO75_23495 [Paenibacillus macerans]|uniref:hypothetical protein n=1 Tax=Paenibacillus macerans TaxID=44252 RepID=UPI002E232902|nr:hypothetical protein [Paenibacillus macerans]